MWSQGDLYALHFKCGVSLSRQVQCCCTVCTAPIQQHCLAAGAVCRGGVAEPPVFAAGAGAHIKMGLRHLVGTRPAL